MTPSVIVITQGKVVCFSPCLTDVTLGRGEVPFKEDKVFLSLLSDWFYSVTHVSACSLFTQVTGERNTGVHTVLERSVKVMVRCRGISK